MVTGIGYCARRGQRKREQQIYNLTNHPEKYNFYPPLIIKERKITITMEDGIKTTKKY